MKLWRNIGLAGGFLLTIPTPAAAHLANSGLGPFYDGSLHLLQSPDDLLGLIAAALLAGLCGARAGRLTALILPAAWLIGGLIGMRLPSEIDLPWLSILSFAVLGVVVAIAPRIPARVVAFMAGLYGALHGLFNGSALGAIGAGPSSLFGIVLTVAVVALLICAAVVSLRQDWTRIAVRVLGSWVAAVGMLMFGWLYGGTG